MQIGIHASKAMDPGLRRGDGILSMLARQQRVVIPM
jgi:hypothetical protein